MRSSVALLSMFHVTVPTSSSEREPVTTRGQENHRPRKSPAAYHTLTNDRYVNKPLWRRGVFERQHVKRIRLERIQVAGPLHHGLSYPSPSTKKREHATVRETQQSIFQCTSDLLTRGSNVAVEVDTERWHPEVDHGSSLQPN